jgi:hypothetical protein
LVSGDFCETPICCPISITWTSVSGGNIMAAHLMLNRSPYNGSEEEFAEASAELLAFVRMDVLNRVVCRFSLAFIANSGRR